LRPRDPGLSHAPCEQNRSPVGKSLEDSIAPLKKPNGPRPPTVVRLPSNGGFHRPTHCSPVCKGGWTGPRLEAPRPLFSRNQARALTTQLLRPAPSGCRKNPQGYPSPRSFPSGGTNRKRGPYLLSCRAHRSGAPAAPMTYLRGLSSARGPDQQGTRAKDPRPNPPSGHFRGMLEKGC